MKTGRLSHSCGDKNAEKVDDTKITEKGFGKVVEKVFTPVGERSPSLEVRSAMVVEKISVLGSQSGVEEDPLKPKFTRTPHESQHPTSLIVMTCNWQMLPNVYGGLERHLTKSPTVKCQDSVELCGS